MCWSPGFYDLIQSSHIYQEGGTISLLHLEMQKRMPQEVKAEASGRDGV